MRIPLDRQSGIPLYQQIEAFLRQGILSGNLPPDTRLPATRELARDLGVNRITVETAYSELEIDGLIASRMGSGTYVLPSVPSTPIPPSDPSAPWPLWQENTQIQITTPKYSRPEELLKASRHPHPINFALGIGDPALFPAEEFRKVIQKVMRRDGLKALEYCERDGYKPLRETIAQVLTSQGLSARAENVLITSGSQQALAITSQLLLKAGDVILVEQPTYAGALNLFRSLRFKLVGVPIDDQGMKVDKLEKLLQQHHPKLIYTIPNFHNPTGICLGAPRRRELIALADRYNVPIMEDDYVGDLRYEGHALPTLKALDPGGRVIYVSTFSKMLMPGLRVGFLVANGPIYEGLANCKRINDLGTSNLIQRSLEAYVTIGRYHAHLYRCCQIYRKRRDAMLSAISSHLPKDVQFTPPHGGLFIWLRLPDHFSVEKLLPLACARGVTFDYGSLYFIDSSEGENYIRLNFVTHSPLEIEEGIRRLGELMK